MAKIDLGKIWDKVAKQWFEKWEPTFKRGLVWGPYGPFEKDVKLIPPLKGKKILVLGCGSGPDVWWLAENGATKVVGVDLSKEQLALAKERMKKAITLCKLIKQFLIAKENSKLRTDKDHYANKRVRLSGDLLATLFKVNFTNKYKLVK